MDVSAQEVIVVGTKRSGLGAIGVLQQRGARVTAMDAEPPAAEDRTRFEAMGVQILPQQIEQIERLPQPPSLIVLSPAVPIDSPFVLAARDKNIPVIGEVELASFFLEGPVLGITGSNGKTTTTALTGHLLRGSGVPCQVGGNIGTAVTRLVDSSKPKQWNVLELSSFQLETVEHFKADIAVCLNVTPDHLDRHHTFREYAAAKRRLFETQTKEGWAILNADDPTCVEFAHHTKGRCLWFSSSKPVDGNGMWLSQDKLLWNNEVFLPRGAISLPGLHNVENIMAAALAAHAAGASPEPLAAAVQTFCGVPHRLELVREVRGVRYYNDSKATNVDAALKAIAAFDGPLWIILGGKDKGAPYTPLYEPLAAKGKAALLIGAPPPYPQAATPLIERDLQGALPLVECGTLETAVHYAHRMASPGDTVLLAPACASFDQFRNFEERGDAFKQVTNTLD
ncbi:MAG: UDP-N-acetylmuramoyl-L-alanine--D-glutamate ligase [Rhodospirillales bacterium]|nr:UDP-N-acetylmuramoyl-L-alanine--D-glutamate ligase [Acetobacter sp.]